MDLTLDSNVKLRPSAWLLIGQDFYITKCLTFLIWMEIFFTVLLFFLKMMKVDTCPSKNKQTM